MAMAITVVVVVTVIVAAGAVMRGGRGALGRLLAEVNYEFTCGIEVDGGGGNWEFTGLLGFWW